MDRATIIQLVEQNADLRDKLFRRGFLLTDDPSVNPVGYPFYNQWKLAELSPYRVFTHPLLPLFVCGEGAELVGLLGHAYNPVSGEYREEALLKELSARGEDDSAWLDFVNELTGVFALFRIRDGKLSLLCDTVGLMSVFCACRNGYSYVSSHSNLIGDLLELSVDPYITALKNSRTFHYFGNQLPGNITQFREVERLNPNHIVSFDGAVRQTRFYWPHAGELGTDEICERFTKLMQSTMELISKKWTTPAISLTGGCDSKTTLAVTKGLYDRFSFFSYDSQTNERPDAEAAAVICKALRLPHTLYQIPYSDDAFPNIEDYRKILQWNGGDIRYNNSNDVRKRLYLDEHFQNDVEVKSWASEVGRARYSKKYLGKRSFGRKPTPRKCTTFYKFLLLDRKVVNQTDRVFRDFLDRCFQQDPEHPIPWQDQFYWEWHWPSRDGVMLVSEQMYSNEITVPYNNRRILELLLSAPQDMRYTDEIYTLVRDRLEPEIDRAAASIVDVNHTKKRAVAETVYYYINNLLPY